MKNYLIEKIIEDPWGFAAFSYIVVKAIINKIFALTQRALKNQERRNRGNRKLTTTKWRNFRGGEPPLRSSKILARTSLQRVFATLLRPKV